jgi:KDO2-lipid IV(A) lauroyltransferase
MTLSARLAQQTGAVLLLAWGERLSWGRGYRIRLRVVLDRASWRSRAAGAGRGAGERADGRRLVRECPSQYLWGYARYKARVREALAR